MNIPVTSKMTLIQGWRYHLSDRSGRTSEVRFNWQPLPGLEEEAVCVDVAQCNSRIRNLFQEAVTAYLCKLPDDEVKRLLWYRSDQDAAKGETFDKDAAIKSAHAMYEVVRGEHYRSLRVRFWVINPMTGIIDPNPQDIDAEKLDSLGDINPSNKK